MGPVGLMEQVLARARPGWLEEAVRRPLADAFSGAGRALGKERVAPTENEAVALLAAGVMATIEQWGLDELGRVVLLLQPGVKPEAIEQCFFRGDNRERQAVLKALPLLDDPERFIALGVEACRTSVEDVFRAIACDNPFPARHFAAASFNQMVLKAIFNGVPVAGIFGLQQHVTSELLRMADDYASERRAAGRTVPDDIAWLHSLAESAEKRGAS
jgi:hypothetical protein